MTRRFLPLVLLLAPLAGCSDASAGAASPGGDGISQEELERLTAGIQKDVEALRGREFPQDVSVALADGEEFRSYIQARIDATETPESLAADEEVAKLLGLLEPDYDLMGEMLDLVESQVGGFYDPTTKRFYLMEQFEGDLALVILAHELTHALDDQLYGLDELLAERKGNTDAQWAFHAVVEGSGTDLMNKWTMENIARLDISAMQEMASMGMEELESAPTYLWKPLVGAYSQGARFLGAAPDDLTLDEAVRIAFEDPPRSSEQVLHPAKYWDDEERDEPVRIAIDRDAIPAGWDVIDEDTLGEIQLALFVEPLERRGGVSSAMEVQTARLTWKAAKGWGGDRYVLLGRGESDRLLYVATTWDRVKDAKEFVKEVEELADHLKGGAADDVRVTLDGQNVHLAIAAGAGIELLDAASGWSRISD